MPAKNLRSMLKGNPPKIRIFKLAVLWQIAGMAWRIHHNVIRGEIDNRTKGEVRGRIWLHGVKQPVQLELRGNAWPDLAGCFLKFRNPERTVPVKHGGHLDLLQRGTVGDMTASRKVRVPDVPLEEFIRWPKSKGKPPEHMGNALYLEWFSEANGRVVVEGADWKLQISAPEWRLTAKENEERAKLAAEGMSEFMRRLGEAIVKHQQGQKDPDEEWDEHDYELFLRESDARTDKYMELLDKYGDSEDARQKIDQEMGWTAKPGDALDEELLNADELNEMLEEALEEERVPPDPSREGIDWIRDEAGHLQHPLQHRCFESAIKYVRLVDQLGLKDSDDSALEEFLSEFQITSTKLAGALAGIPYGQGFSDPAFTVAYLKRALGHLHKAQSGLEAVALRELLPKKAIVEARQELFAIREGILRLMDEFRGRK